ncbi:MAG: hypothetical protein LBU98_01400 [Alistipes sp.]|jgi:hypothetical protein|nr:hypothetical protein [Alistipes sp.]
MYEFIDSHRGRYTAPDGDAAHHYGGVTSELSLSRFAQSQTIPILDPETELVAFARPASEFAILREMAPAADIEGDAARLAALKPDDNPVLFLYRLR